MAAASNPATASATRTATRADFVTDVRMIGPSKRRKERSRDALIVLCRLSVVKHREPCIAAVTSATLMALDVAIAAAAHDDTASGSRSRTARSRGIFMSHAIRWVGLTAL